MLQSAIFGRALFGQAIFGSGQSSTPSIVVPVAPPDRTFNVPKQYGDDWLGYKTPEELLNFSFNWANEIETDLIVSSIWEIESSDIANVAAAIDPTGTITTILTSGGLPASIYNITNFIKLTSGLQIDATFRLIVNAYNY